jgi:tetratricopeptide (TPR) repeat protein
MMTAPGILALGLAFALVLPFANNAWSFLDPALEKVRRERAQERADAYLSEGKIALEKGHYIRATRVLTDAIRLGAGPEALKLRARAFDMRNDPDAALRDLNSYLDVVSSDPEGYALRGGVRVLAHRFGQAIKDYSAAIRLDGNLLDAYRGRAIAYTAAEDYEMARKDLETVLQHVPGDTEALTNLEVACRLSGMHEAAEHFARRALALEMNESWREVISERLVAERGLTGPMPAGGPSSFLSWGPDGTNPTAGAVANVRTANVSPEAHETLIDRETNVSAHKSIQNAMAPHQPELPNLSGRWEAAYLGHDVTLLVKHRDRQLSGVMTVRSPVGKELTYHFSGTFDGTNVVASHHSGHTFRGKFTSSGKLVGVLSTREGKSFDVNLSR